MGLSPWLTLRQAKEALRHGRPDEAHRLLDPLLADAHRKAWRLAREVARGYVARGEKSLRADNMEAAWKDLLAAEALNTGEAEVAEFRRVLTRIGVAACRAALEAGNPAFVVETAARMRERNTRHPELSALDDAAQDWVLAAEMAGRGDFPLARTLADKVRPKLAGPTTGLDGFVQELEAREAAFRTAVGKLEEAAAARHWRQVVHLADEVIAAAPHHRGARTLRSRAWESLEPATREYVPDGDGGEVVPLSAAVAAAYAETRSSPAARPRPTTSPGVRPASTGLSLPGSTAPLPKRFLLWIDGVGGYLVCLSPRVTFGQATGNAPIDVPLFADVSRLHAEVTRDGEGYLLESTRGVQVNGEPTDKAVLRAGDRVTLGPTCQLLFQQPVAVSPSARLELVSGHRLPLAVDGVLLMAETLILGPGPQCHVCLPNVDGTVILYRSKDGLGVRHPGEFTIDRRPFTDRATLPLPSVVAADSFTFAVEPVGSRL